MNRNDDYQKYAKERERAAEKLQEQIGQQFPIEPTPQVITKPKKRRTGVARAQPRRPRGPGT